MRIGVITFCNTEDNYGQILQCWALQYVLRTMGHNPFVINYTKKPYTPWLKRIFKLLLVYPIFKYYNKRHERILNERDKNILRNKNKLRKFDEFRKKNISFTTSLYRSINELRKKPPFAQCYITGSDQVWAQLLDRSDNLAYFLDFGSRDTKRISYAPSFSMDQYPSNLKSRLKKALGKLDDISVREKSGVIICNDLGYDAKLVCDPTLLIEASVFKELCNLKPTSKNQIFLYYINVTNSRELYWDKIREYASKCHLNIVATNASGYIYAKELLGDDVIYDYCTVEKWLENIISSKVVVTTSFHGVVFSIILHVPFVYIPLRNKWGKGNNRVLDLLDDLQLSNRAFSGIESDLEIIANSPIDWDMVDSKVHEIRISSMSFLVNSIK